MVCFIVRGSEQASSSSRVRGGASHFNQLRVPRLTCRLHGQGGQGAQGTPSSTDPLCLLCGAVSGGQHSLPALLAHPASPIRSDRRIIIYDALCLQETFAFALLAAREPVFTVSRPPQPLGIERATCHSEGASTLVGVRLCGIVRCHCCSV